MFDSTRNQAQIDACRKLLERLDDIHLDLFEAAKALKLECEDVLRQDTSKKYRKPPFSLAVRSESGKVGPKIVWVSFAKKPNMVQDGQPLRFTRELPGRSNGRYPKTIFSAFHSPTREALIDIENRAAVLRKRIFFWRATLSEARKIIEEGAN